MTTHQTSDTEKLYRRQFALQDLQFEPIQNISVPRLVDRFTMDPDKCKNFVKTNFDKFQFNNFQPKGMPYLGFFELNLSLDTFFRLVDEKDFKKLNLNPNLLMLECFLKFQGQCSYVHTDRYTQFQKKYGSITPLRYWIAMHDIQLGHVLQVGNHNIQYKCGDVYQIDGTIPHCAGNIGTIPQINLVVTGTRIDK